MTLAEYLNSPQRLASNKPARTADLEVTEKEVRKVW